jgi:hypothetical protein
VTNLFNTKNVSDVYTETGMPDTRQSQYTRALEGYEIYDYVVLPGSEWDQNPYNYAAGRNVRLGFSVNF